MNPGWLLLTLLLAGIASGCSKGGRRADLIILNGAEPESLDPAFATGQPDLRAVGAIFEGLTRSDPRTGRAIPGLAERWDVSPDGRRYAFHLRAGARWSTGDPISADDVVYSWRRVLEPETGCDYAGQLFYVRNAEPFNRGDLKDFGAVGVRARESRLVEVELEGPTPFFLELCAIPTAAIVPRWVIEQEGDRWLMVRPLPVSGPFELVSWRLNDRIRLRKNPLYWDAANTASEWIDLLPVGSANTAMNLYETGAADIGWDKDLIPVELLDLLLQRPDFHTFQYLGTYFLRINVTRPPYQDPRVRQALALAIDKLRIVTRITRAGEQPASHLTPPLIAEYRPPGGLGHDPAAARRLLAEAGFPGGRGFPVVRYTFNASAGGAGKAHQDIAVELQEMWQRELGIRIELRQVEWKVFLAAQTALDYEICRSSWIADYSDPNTFLDLFHSGSGNNRTGWTNAAYDRLLRAANTTTDTKRRMEILASAEQILVGEELPIIPLYFYQGIHYYDATRIEGIYTNAIDQHPLQAIRRKAPLGASL